MTDDLWPLGPDELADVIPLLHGPGAAHWPANTVAWCQRCDTPIRDRQDRMPRIPFLTTAGGLDHVDCPPRLVVVS